MKLNIKLVAKKANVSASTVSRVLNNSGYASETTREKVLAVVKELGYRQNIVARTLRKKTSNSIGLIVPDISNEFYSILAKSIESILQQENFSLFLCNSEEDERKEQFYIESLLDNQVSGIILCPTKVDYTQSFFQRKVPLVLLDKANYQGPSDNIVYIESDNFNGAKLAGEILIRHGATKFVHLQGCKPFNSMRQRREGFICAMNEHRIASCDYQIHEIRVSPLAALQKVREIYSRFQFDGLFCSTDSMAIGAINGLLNLGLEIPNDIQVIGFDGIALGEYFNPPLSTIRQDIEQMGHIAGEKILRMVEGNKHVEHIVLPTEFIKRRSTR